MHVFDFIPGEVNVPMESPDGELLLEEDGQPQMESKKVYEGKITIRIPTQIERLEYSQDVNLELRDGELVAASGTTQLIKLMKIASNHIVDIKLKRIDTDYEINDVETLNYDKDATALLGKIAQKVIRGVALGNGSRSQ